MNLSMILRAHNIRKSYETPTLIEVLKGISLEIAPTETIAIMGKSGEGKSTLLHILGTLEKPTSGSLEIGGKSAERSTPSLRNKHIGFVFQTFNLLEDYTVLENILMPALIARQPIYAGSKSHRRACELLCEVGLQERAHHLAKLLSGGEKQRVALARALINDPDLLLADEPSGNLDQTTSAAIHELLLKAAKERGKALLVVTHDHELAALCDRQLLLKAGTLWTS